MTGKNLLHDMRVAPDYSDCFGQCLFFPRWSGNGGNHFFGNKVCSAFLVGEEVWDNDGTHYIQGNRLVGRQLL